MKITHIQVQEAFHRVMWGESRRKVARSFGVSEGLVRYHFKKKGATPEQINAAAMQIVESRIKGEMAERNLQKAQRDLRLLLEQRLLEQRLNSV